MSNDRVLERLDLEFPLEPERYELNARPAYYFEVDRREFFKFLGAGILIVCALKGVHGQESGSGKRGPGEELPQDIGGWLHIGERGIVTVYTGKVEVGQNIRTSLSQAVAEELLIGVEKIQTVMGDTQLTPFDMGTFGSRTTPTMSPQLRKAAAAARELLMAFAAAEWKADRRRLIAAEGKITDPQSKRSVEYGALIKGAATYANYRSRRRTLTCDAVEGARAIGEQSRWPRLCYR
jgi:nicotinate dehydrogenase subunit B